MESLEAGLRLGEVGIPEAHHALEGELAHQKAVHPAEGELDEGDALARDVIKERCVYPSHQFFETAPFAGRRIAWRVVILYPIQ